MLLLTSIVMYIFNSPNIGKITTVMMCSLGTTHEWVIVIYLGGIYSSHVSSKEGTQRCCFDFNTKRS